MIPPTPSEIAELAFIRRNDPETALRIAEQSGRAFDQQTLKAQKDKNDATENHARR